jgi:nucleoside 2-deoxyribosyltransferase
MSIPKRFYISTRYDRRTDAATLMDLLRRRGWVPSFDWTGVQDYSNLAALAVAEIDGVREADAVIVLLPGGFGTHVELGAALAFGKPLVVHARNRSVLEEPYPCVFHYHPAVQLIVSDILNEDEILARLQTCAGEK